MELFMQQQAWRELNCFNKHWLRAINDVFKTPSKLGSMALDSAEALGPCRAGRLDSNKVCEVRLDQQQHWCLSQGDEQETHPMELSHLALQSTNTKRLHPHPASQCARTTEQAWGLPWTPAGAGPPSTLSSCVLSTSQEQRFPGQLLDCSSSLWSCFVWSETPLLAAFPCPHHLPCVPIPAWAAPRAPGWTKLSTSSTPHLPVSMVLHTSHHPLWIAPV